MACEFAEQPPDPILILHEAKVTRSTPAAPLFLRTRSHASHSTSPLWIRSYRAWKRRPSDCLAAAHSRRWSSRTFTGDGRPSTATTR